MASYTNEYANFPTSLITLHDFQDIGDDVAVLVNNIQSLRSEGKYDEATKLIRNNSDLLENRIVGAEWFRTQEEEIRNTQIFARSAQQMIYDDETEPDIAEGDIWIGG